MKERKTQKKNIKNNIKTALNVVMVECIAGGNKRGTRNKKVATTRRQVEEGAGVKT